MIRCRSSVPPRFNLTYVPGIMAYLADIDLQIMEMHGEHTITAQRARTVVASRPSPCMLVAFTGLSRHTTVLDHTHLDLAEPALYGLYGF